MAHKLINTALLLGGGFVVFYVLIYGTLWLAVAILGGLEQRPDEDASFFDGDGVGEKGSGKRGLN